MSYHIEHALHLCNRKIEDAKDTIKYYSQQKKHLVQNYGGQGKLIR